MSRTTRFSNQSTGIEEENKTNKDETGFLNLRTNYSRIKPYSKYTTEGIRPKSPNLPYSFLSDKLITQNPKNDDSIFRKTRTAEDFEKDKQTEITRFYNERHTETYNEHLIRGQTASQPFGYIAKEPHNNYLPAEYTASIYGAYPTWGPSDTGFRTRSHYVAEPVERFVNIDMYKRPLTNQAGKIIFDHGRPNNGYYLQRHQYDNTWFDSKLKLNKTDILKSVAPKTLSEYQSQNALQKSLVRSKTICWPFASEYVEKFTINSKN